MSDREILATLAQHLWPKGKHTTSTTSARLLCSEHVKTGWQLQMWDSCELLATVAQQVWSTGKHGLLAACCTW
jgi:hypothetical protein